MSELIITECGLRGIVGETLTPEVAMRYAAAFSSTIQEGCFVVSWDSRPSGTLLADAIHAALNAVGRPTLDAGIASTPTMGILVRQHNAAGGIQITASHNPFEFNGMKLFSAAGRVLPKESGLEVLKRYHENRFDWVSQYKVGRRHSCIDTTSTHLAAVLRTVNIPTIRRNKFRVLLDSNHGSGSILGKPLLDALGCETSILGDAADGLFEHEPEPIQEHLQSVCRIVQDRHIDVAFCQDPDADRFAIIDADGRYIGEEYTMALCLEHFLRMTGNPEHSFFNKKGPVVINSATSRMNEDIAIKYGVPLYRSPVGEANVVDLMLEKKAVIGGEGNGGFIYPEVGLVRDSFVGMAQVLESMAITGKTVAQLVDEIPSYVMVKHKVTAALDKVPAMIDKVATAMKGLSCDRQDGLRINHGNAWVLIRGSNTEPIIRIFAEASNETRANSLCYEIENILKKESDV